MGYSQQVLDMLQQTVSGQIDNFWDFSFTFNALNDFELMRNFPRLGIMKTLKCLTLSMTLS